MWCFGYNGSWYTPIYNNEGPEFITCARNTNDFSSAECFTNYEVSPTLIIGSAGSAWAVLKVIMTIPGMFENAGAEDFVSTTFGLIFVTIFLLIVVGIISTVFLVPELDARIGAPDLTMAGLLCLFIFAVLTKLMSRIAIREFEDAAFFFGR